MGWIWALHGVMTILFIIFIIYTISYSINYSKYGKRTVRDIAKIEFDSPVTTYYLDSATGEKRKRVFYKSKRKYGYADGANYRYTRSGLNFNIAFAVILPVVYIILAAIYHYWIMEIPIDEKAVEIYHGLSVDEQNYPFFADLSEINDNTIRGKVRKLDIVYKYPVLSIFIYLGILVSFITYGAIIWSDRNSKYYITKTDIYNEKDELIETIIGEKY